MGLFIHAAINREDLRTMKAQVCPFVVLLIVLVGCAEKQLTEEQVRELLEANREQIRKLSMALAYYEERNKMYPAYASFGGGQPLLSWRVLILPDLGYDELYRKFRLNEPWDSDHNKQLIAAMPSVYLPPYSRNNASDGMTNYLGVKGERFFFRDIAKPRSFSEIKDSNSETVAFVQVADEYAEPWTKPRDWEAKPLDPFEKLGGFPGVFSVGFAALGATSIVDTGSETEFLKILTIDGGETVIWELLR
jgi:hypothetical protein